MNICLKIHNNQIIITIFVYQVNLGQQFIYQIKSSTFTFGSCYEFSRLYQSILSF